MVNQSSITSYNEGVRDGTIPRQRDDVYDTIMKEGPLSNRMIATILGIDTASVSPRVHSLMESGLVQEAYYAKCRAPLNGNRKPKRVRYVEVVWPQQMEMRL